MAKVTAKNTFNLTQWLELFHKSIRVEQRANYRNVRGQHLFFADFMLAHLERFRKTEACAKVIARLQNIFNLYPACSVAERKAFVDESLLLAESLKEPVVPARQLVRERIKSAVAKQQEKADWRDTPVNFVKGVGSVMAGHLQRIGIATVGELITYYPRRHLNYAECTRIRDARVGDMVTIWGIVHKVDCFSPPGNRNMTVLNVTVRDGSGLLRLNWFYRSANRYLQQQYKNRFPLGAQVLVSGEIKWDKYSKKLAMDKPEAELLGEGDGEGDTAADLPVGRIIPVYPLTEGLSLKWLRKVMHHALETYLPRLQDPLPEPLRQAQELIELRQALREFHFPTQETLLAQARRRLVFDELFFTQLGMMYKRKQREQFEAAISFPQEGELPRRFRAALPFQLTGAQERVVAEISRDLDSPLPMSRLVQGDVGSGKTVVAVLALLQVIENGYQGALMAPTEILAEQHYRKMLDWLLPLGLQVELLLGRQGTKARRESLARLESGQAQVAVGTHALIQEEVAFQKLGLAVIDEQHRFGVLQRAMLKAKGLNPEILTMTATPIPRTLALAIYGDLDVSIIDELPPGRKPIETMLASGRQIKHVWDLIRAEIDAGRQCYLVFPLVEESEKLELKAATTEYAHYKNDIFPGYRVGLLHGQMKGKDKDHIMRQFAGHQLDVLVATTVIEVGVDVPNASVMVIEHAERFGLAQLHQLRGRVGRGADKAYCILLSDKLSEQARERLEIFTQTQNGFVIAEQDLRLRGPGEFLGVRQSGLPDLVLADLARDTQLLELSRSLAAALIQADPNLEQGGHYLLKQELLRFFRNHLEFLEA